jgi:hypothetical protein
MSSSHQIEQAGSTQKFTITAVLAFALVFSFLLLMSTCHGPFKPITQNTEASAESAVEK